MSRVVEADDKGAVTLDSETLGGSEPHARYVVEKQGERIVLEPDGPKGHARRKRKPRATKLTPDEWIAEWREWSAEVSAKWNSDKSAAEIISEMRR